jgi:hypothetical protein
MDTLTEMIEGVVPYGQIREEGNMTERHAGAGAVIDA